MQVTVVGILVLFTIELLSVATGLALLMVLTGISCTSILAILFLAVAIIVLTVTLLGVSKTREIISINFYIKNLKI